jgi:hypothetical protein
VPADEAFLYGKTAVLGVHDKRNTLYFSRDIFNVIKFYVRLEDKIGTDSVQIEMNRTPVCLDSDISRTFIILCYTQPPRT